MMRLRDRVVILASVMLVLVGLLSVSVTCACVMSNHPGQAMEWVQSAMPTVLPASTPVVWALVLIILLPSALLFTRRQGAFGRASPEELQRFLF